jgi:hypothetical protein
LRRVGTDWFMAPATITFAGAGAARRALWRRPRHPVAARQSRSHDRQRLLARSRARRPGDRQPRFLRRPPDGSFPRAEARLNITGFTRTGIAVRSSPVDLFIAGNLTPEGGAAARSSAAAARSSAAPRRGFSRSGRRRARGRTRLLAAPLAGGVRYNGPADVPMSFASLPGHQLTGPIGLAADFTGRLQNPQFTTVSSAPTI